MSIANPLSLQYAKDDGVLCEYMDHLYNMGIKKATAYNYYMSLRSLAKYLAHRRYHLECSPEEVILERVTPSDMASLQKDEWDDFLDYCRFTRRETGRSFAVRISIIRGFYRWLEVKTGFPSPLFVQQLRCGSFEHAPYIEITEAKEAALCRSLQGLYPLRNVCIVRIFLRCGLGLQELCDLDLEDVEVNSIVVKRGSVARRIPLDEVTAAAVEEYLPVRFPPLTGGNPFFVSEKRGRIKRGAIEKMLRKAVQLGGSQLAGISIRDMKLTAQQRLVSQYGLEQAQALSSVDSWFYFRKKHRDASPKEI